MKLVIAGGRYFRNYALLEEKVTEFIGNNPDVIVLSGKEPYGADKLGERYALERGLPILAFPPDWGNYGKAAGPIRNREMAKNADAVIVFWDGKSRGTLSMINRAKKMNLLLKVVYYEKATQNFIEEKIIHSV